MEHLDIEVREAIKRLEKFEANLPSIENINKSFNEIETLNNYLIEDHETPHKAFINGQKEAHTKRVLNSLKSINSSDYQSWLLVVKALLKANGETEKLLKSIPVLKKVYDDFFAEWKDSPKLLNDLNPGEKSLMPYMV